MKSTSEAQTRTPPAAGRSEYTDVSGQRYPDPHLANPHGADVIEVAHDKWRWVSTGSESRPVERNRQRDDWSVRHQRYVA